MHLRSGSTATPPWSLQVTPEVAGWTYAGLRVLELPPDGSASFATGGEEMLVLPLSGSATVECAGQRFELAGRASPFAGVSDFGYLPIEAAATIRGQGRFALPSARARRRLPPRYGPAGDVPIEQRGAGPAARTVHNFAAPQAFDCHRLVAVEVLTPGGNWSSYPPHKHDEAGRGEAALEEIYYFEITRDGVGYQRVYSSPRGRIDVLAEVRTGDVVLVPYGYHGPSMAPPGYPMYYLNVLAGPGAARTMAFTDDPAHAWVRRSWGKGSG